MTFTSAMVQGYYYHVRSKAFLLLSYCCVYTDNVQVTIKY